LMVSGRYEVTGFSMPFSMRRPVIVTLVAAVGAMLCGSPAAQAAFPGVNGKLAFNQFTDAEHTDIFSVDLGSGGAAVGTPTDLTNTPTVDDLGPGWSPDGSK